MSDFDPIKAQREELVGLQEAEKQLKLIAQHKEAVIDEATHERDGLLKAVSVLQEIIRTGLARMRALEEEAERKAAEAKAAPALAQD